MAEDGTRILALDYGVARCGCALSDPTGTLATPIEPVLRPATRKGLARVADLVRERGVGRVVVGLPLSLSGADSAQTTETRAWAARLAERVDVPVELYDERFTTVTADRSMQERDMKADARRKVVDQVAAAVLLQAWLDGPGARRG